LRLRPRACHPVPETPGEPVPHARTLGAARALPAGSQADDRHARGPGLHGGRPAPGRRHGHARPAAGHHPGRGPRPRPAGGRMIAVTRLDGAAMLLNVDVIYSVERTPDTLISLANGETLMVRETPDEILERIIRFKHAVLDGHGGESWR